VACDDDMKESVMIRCTLSAAIAFTALGMGLVPATARIAKASAEKSHQGERCVTGDLKIFR
jgi:hypothetical protein